MALVASSSIAATGLLVMAVPAHALPAPWPSPTPPAPGWPRPIPDQPFVAALAPQPLALPLRRCGIGDCLRALPPEPSPPGPDRAPGLAELFATSPFTAPFDHRHAAALAAVMAITMLFWRNRGRRNTGA